MRAQSGTGGVDVFNVDVTWIAESGAAFRTGVRYALDHGGELPADFVNTLSSALKGRV